MKSIVISLSLLFACICLLLSGQSNPVLAEQASSSSWLTGRSGLPFVIPENLCNCSRHPIPAGGVQTAEDFFKRYSWIKFANPQEANLGWRVFRAVNRCDSDLVIGRLDDTEQFPGLPGICVLRDYLDWSVAINDSFIVAGTDRRARFLAVSVPPGEIELQPGGDARHHRRNVYNRELSLVRQSGRYQPAQNLERASTNNPIYFVPLDNHNNNERVVPPADSCYQKCNQIKGPGREWCRRGCAKKERKCPPCSDCSRAVLIKISPPQWRCFEGAELIKKIE